MTAPKTKTYILAFLVLCMPAVAEAASMRIQAPAQVAAGSVFEATLVLDSDVAVNAFGAVLDVGGLSVVDVSDGGSIVSAWVVPPAAAGSRVSFEGVTAGSYRGRGGVVVRMFVRAPASGTAVLRVQEPRVLRADGTGGAEPVEASSVRVAVHAGARAEAEPADTVPPEHFQGYYVEAGEDAYVAFAAQDKGSGVRTYDVAERRFVGPLVWHRAESPYLLEDQFLTSTIYIKATDRAGNEQIEVVHRKHLVRPNELLIGCILIVCALGSFYVRRWRLLRRH